MIRNFKSRALQRLMERGDGRRIRAEHRETVRDILARLNASRRPRGHEPARLSAAPVERRPCRFLGRHGPRQLARDFRFEDGHVVDVDYVDYH